MEIGEIVYIKTDIDQYERVITKKRTEEYPNKTSLVMYGVSFGDFNESYHYDFELSKNKDILKTLTN